MQDRQEGRVRNQLRRENPTSETGSRDRRHWQLEQDYELKGRRCRERDKG
jgi:hypothetical protein